MLDRSPILYVISQFVPSTSRAQSTVIGVVLLTGVVIITVTAIGAFWIGTIDDQADASGPLVEVDANVTENTVELDHRMGDSVLLSDLTLLLRNDSTTERYPVDQANVSGGDGDDRFDPGEDFTRQHSLGLGSIELVLIHEPSNTVLYRELFDVQP